MTDNISKSDFLHLLQRLNSVLNDHFGKIYHSKIAYDEGCSDILTIFQTLDILNKKSETYDYMRTIENIAGRSSNNNS